MNALVEQDPKWEFKKKSFQAFTVRKFRTKSHVEMKNVYERGSLDKKKTLAMFRFRPKKRKGNMIAFVVFFSVLSFDLL